jgi:hypothetical protein
VTASFSNSDPGGAHDPVRSEKWNLLSRPIAGFSEHCPAKKGGRAGKPASKPKTDRANKKAEVIAMMKRAKGATLAEIMAATKWQAHTVRGFILRSAAPPSSTSS